MNYDEWRALAAAAAIEQYCMEASEVMIPYAEAHGAATRKASEARGTNAPNSFALPDLTKHDWRAREWMIADAIIAIERCGYDVTRK